MFRVELNPMATLKQIENTLKELLQPDLFNDYCPNGLQIEGTPDVKRLITGVTACQALIDQAVEKKADAILVHHGYFWKGEAPCLTGIKRKRIATLIESNISLLAYHLPLDAHSGLGNNACVGNLLAKVLDIKQIIPGDESQLVWQAKLKNPVTSEVLRQHLADSLGHQSSSSILHIAGGKDAGSIQNLAWCTGAAQGYIDQAADMGVDAYISGEVSEQTVHIARERGVHYFAAGHHATERFGVQALGNHLAKNLGIEHQFIDIDNPI